MTRRIDNILTDEEALAEIRDMVENGSNLSTINAAMSYPPRTIEKIIDKGREAKKGPYYEFYMQWRSWAAKAKQIAEEKMLAKSPEKWLDRSTTAKRIQSEEETELIVADKSNNQPTNNQPVVGAEELLASLNILADHGLSIDEALQKRQIQLDKPKRIEE